MLLAQVGIAIGLFQLAGERPGAGMRRIVIWDLFLDVLRRDPGHRDGCLAHRIGSGLMQGAMAAAYQVGYRVALIAGSAGALTLAQASTGT